MADTGNHNDVSSDPGNSGELTLSKLFSSKEWIEYFDQLSRTVNFELSVFNEEGERLVLVNENPFCKFLRSAHLDNLNCPESCDTLIRSAETGISRCLAQVMTFSFPVERLNDRVYIAGRGGFAEYEDLIEFIKIVQDNRLPRIPVSMPLSFPGEEYVKAVSEYVHLSIRRQLDSFEEKHKMEEKLLRMTSLFDSQTFGTLSNNPQLLYRYMLDTIEFVFGSTSSALLLFDEEDSAYKTVCSTGPLKDVAENFYIDKENPAIHEMTSTRSALFYQDLEQIPDAGPLQDVRSSYFFPIFIGAEMKCVIAIFDKQFSHHDMKVMNAFKDYVQLNLENHDLRITVKKTKRSDKKTGYLADFSSTITTVLDRELLLKKLLEKSLQILSAEQGSLMLLDNETSELVVEACKSRSDKIMEKMRLNKDEGIVGKVLDSGNSMLIEDIEKDPRTRQENRDHYSTKSFISALINIEDRVTGVINISDKTEGGAFNEEDLNLIRSIIDNSAIAIERSLLYDKTEELKKLSITDPLTGIFNRRYLNRRLSEEITRYNRYKHPFSFMMLDLDKFKEYNDTFGHVAGDDLIRTLANVIERSLRAIDIAARFGGDEFVAIFPQTPKSDAIQICGRLKDQIDVTLNELNVEMPLSISMGLATYPDDASSIMELIERTDQALYLAKKDGGNKVVFL